MKAEDFSSSIQIFHASDSAYLCSLEKYCNEYSQQSQDF